MLTLQEFDPKPAAETQRLAFDFDLESGELLASATVSCVVWSGVDATPSTMVGAVTYSASQVFAIISAGVAGAIYLLTATATTSLGRTLQKQGYLGIRGAT